MSYTLVQGGNAVYHNPSGLTIPLPARESNGWAYVAWLAAGNTPAPAYVPIHIPTKDQRIAEILSVIPDLTRREVQLIIAVTELNAKLELAITGTPIADSLADSLAEALARNPSYKLARYLEDKCRVVDKS